MTEKELISALTEILSERVEKATEREQEAFDQLTGPNGKSIVLFGTGTLGRKTLCVLRDEGIEPYAFCDNNPALRGKKIEGIPVFGPEKAAALLGGQAVFIVTIWNDSIGHPLEMIKSQLDSLGKVNVVSFLPLYWKYHTRFLPYFCLDLPHKVLRFGKEIMEAAGYLEDGESRENYLANVRFRLGLEMDFQSLPSSSDQHFNFDFILKNPEEVFVDAGAFTGDTLRGLLSRPDCHFKKIMALEPDPENHAELDRYVNSLHDELRQKVKTYQVAALDKNAVIHFDASGTDQAQISESGTYPVQARRLDELFGKLEPTFIKMDIEGAEPEAVEGCSGLMKKNPPVLAISVYHKFNHLWTILLAIKKLQPDYHYFIRAHAAGGWDTILYAVPTSRMARHA